MSSTLKIALCLGIAGAFGLYAYNQWGPNCKSCNKKQSNNVPVPPPSTQPQNQQSMQPEASITYAAASENDYTTIQMATPRK